MLSLEWRNGSYGSVPCDIATTLACALLGPLCGVIAVPDVQLFLFRIANLFAFPPLIFY